ncbi:BTB/POZ domain-containing protein 6-B-like isoform X1 [Macrobrachium rosenbergii]|uniref:BTB/POZ domain-containing protein 6-B-like isoform X1 n=1 Tax=Macrobrachium rosenbergii TaxID=79674 RepID=UPI0034D6E4EF
MPRTPRETAPWQEGLSHPLERLSSLYDRAELSDLTITFPNDKLSLKVHRLILAMSSPVFEAMFYGPMAEKGDLTLPEDPPKAFAFLMGYIYKGNASLPDVDMAVMVYKLASKYQMGSLCSVCSEYLQSHTDLNNLALLYEMSFLYEDSKLKEKCRKVVNDSRQILSSPRVGQLSPQCMEDLLQQKLPVESEVAVFKGLLQWGTLQADNSSTSTEWTKGLRQEIETLLPHIRFLTMTLDDFVEHVMPSGVLTPEESNAIMMNIKRVGNISLPVICSPNRETRVACSRLHQISLRIGNHVIGKPTIINPKWAPVSVDFRLFKKEDEDNQIFSRRSTPKYNCQFASTTINGLRTVSAPMYDLLSGVTVSMHILVGCIEITILNSGNNMHGSNATVSLKIQSSSGDILREINVVANLSGPNTIISAILEKPLLLSPNNVYSISSSSSHGQHNYHQYNYHQPRQSNVSLTYGNLNVSGVMSCDAALSLAFWCSSDLF